MLNQAVKLAERADSEANQHADLPIRAPVQPHTYRRGEKEADERIREVVAELVGRSPYRCAVGEVLPDLPALSHAPPKIGQHENAKSCKHRPQVEHILPQLCRPQSRSNISRRCQMHL